MFEEMNDGLGQNEKSQISEKLTRLLSTTQQTRVTSAGQQQRRSGRKRVSQNL